MARKFAGAGGALTFVVSFVVAQGESPPVLVARNWKLYVVFAAKPVIVAVVALAPGAGVHVVQFEVPDTRYCNV